MAEFCIDCWNKINETHEPESNYIISNGQELCEGCGEYKRVIVAERRCYCKGRFARALICIKNILNFNA